jgi:peptidoglycan/LPS O-acetylase OafA/YrhL
LSFTPDFREGANGLYNLLIVPPAWSLSVEIYFYLLAPWIVRLRTPAIFALIAASLLCRAILAWQLGWQGDPWSYRFSPSELAFFLTGVLAYRANVHDRLSIFPWTLTLLVLGGSLGLAETLGLWQPDMPLLRWARVPLFAFLAAGTPMLFSLTKDWRFDRQIGELSYPLYVSHFLVIWVVGFVFADLATAAARLTLAVCAILAALALRKWVDVPVDRFRQARLRKRAGAVAADVGFANQGQSSPHGTGLPVSAGK